jgi:hypothetical protein
MKVLSRRGLVYGIAVAAIAVIALALVLVFIPPTRGAVTGFIVWPVFEEIVLILTAIGTVGSVITALVIATRAERRQDTRDRTENSANLERRAERQAVLVKIEKGGTTEGASTGGQRVYQTRVLNLSDHPIFNVRLALATVSGGGIELHWGSTPVWEVPPHDIRDSDTFSVPRDEEPAVVGAHAIFLDAYGDTWKLDSEGTLELNEARTIRRG